MSELTLFEIEDQIKNLEDQKLQLAKDIENNRKLQILKRQIENDIVYQNEKNELAIYVFNVFDKEGLGKYFKVERKETTVRELLGRSNKNEDLEILDTKIDEIKLITTFGRNYTSYVTPKKENGKILIRSNNIFPQGQYRDVNIKTIVNNMKEKEVEFNAIQAENLERIRIGQQLIKKYSKKYPDAVITEEKGWIDYGYYGNRGGRNSNGTTVYYIKIAFANENWIKIKYSSTTDIDNVLIHDKFKKIIKEQTPDEIIEEYSK